MHGFCCVCGLAVVHPSRVAMGVPKFYRWLSERYPRINQLLDENQPMIDLQIDHLYFDMNGVIHLCTHPSSDEAIMTATDEEIYRNLEIYLDRVITRVIRPRKSIYFAIDGVAPRAKLNQQRGRRFCAGRARYEISFSLFSSLLLSSSSLIVVERRPSS
jgi:5'-3' exoribonuclease 1